MKNLNELGVIDLSIDELISTDGGKPWTYYVSYAAGLIWGTTVCLFAGISGGIKEEHI